MQCLINLRIFDMLTVFGDYKLRAFSIFFSIEVYVAEEIKIFLLIWYNVYLKVILSGCVHNKLKVI